jgi:hypothetical protein
MHAPHLPAKSVSLVNQVVNINVVREMKREMKAQNKSQQEEGKAPQDPTEQTRWFLEHLIRVFTPAEQGLLDSRPLNPKHKARLQSSLHRFFGYLYKVTYLWERKAKLREWRKKEASKHFFSLITLEQLVVTTVAFRLFTDYFTRHLPGHFLVTLRCNQTPLEGHFCVQRAYVSGSNPNAQQYRSTVGKVTVQKEIPRISSGSYDVANQLPLILHSSEVKPFSRQRRKKWHDHYLQRTHETQSIDQDPAQATVPVARALDFDQYALTEETKESYASVAKKRPASIRTPMKNLKQPLEKRALQDISVDHQEQAMQGTEHRRKRAISPRARTNVSATPVGSPGQVISPPSKKVAPPKKVTPQPKSSKIKFQKAADGTYKVIQSTEDLTAEEMFEIDQESPNLESISNDDVEEKLEEPTGRPSLQEM